MVKYRWIALIVVFVMVTAAGCGKQQPPIREEVPVKVSVIEQKSDRSLSSYAGEVRPRYQTDMAFQVSGKIIKRLVDVGATVQAGDSLLIIDRQDVSLEVGKAEAQLRAAQSDADLAEINFNRYSALYHQAAISKSEYDRAANSRDSAAAKLEQAGKAYAATLRQLNYTTLTADHAGVVAEMTAEVGQVVSQGQKVLVLAQPGEKEVEIHIPEQLLGEFDGTPEMRVTFWAFPDMAVKGTIREIAPAADRVTRTYTAKIALVDLPEKVKIGMTANVRVEEKAGREIYLPLSALLQSGDKPGVWLVKDNVLTLRHVTVGRYGNNQVQIVEGLNSGDAVVTAGVHKLAEGQRVRIWDGSGVR